MPFNFFFKLLEYNCNYVYNIDTQQIDARGQKKKHSEVENRMLKKKNEEVEMLALNK